MRWVVRGVIGGVIGVEESVVLLRLYASPHTNRFSLRNDILIELKLLGHILAQERMPLHFLANHFVVVFSD